MTSSQNTSKPITPAEFKRLNTGSEYTIRQLIQRMTRRHMQILHKSLTTVQKHTDLTYEQGQILVRLNETLELY